MTAAVARIPADLLYWGHLPAGTARGAALAYRFERVLPVPVEQVHTTHVPTADGGVLIVGIEPERLRSHLAVRPDIDPSTWELVPDRLPDHLLAIAGAGQRLAGLNLLHGEFEPAPHRRLRRIMWWVVQLGVAATALLAVVGVERRVQAAHDHAAEQRRAAQTALLSVVPASAGALKPEVRLTMEVRRLEQAARDPAATSLDLAQTLQALWHAWPPGLRVQVDTLGANAERIVIRGRTAGLAEAEQVARACARIVSDGVLYRADPLQAQHDERGATFLLTLVRQDPGGHP